MMATSSPTPRPATISSKVLSSTSSKVGWGTQVPSWLYAMRTAPIGPWKGMPEIMSDADAPLMASTS